MNSASENKLFTVLLNRQAMLGIALLLSTLLPINQAAPMAKTSIYSNKTTSIPSTTVSSSSSLLSFSAVQPVEQAQIQLNNTISADKKNVSSPVGIAAALSATQLSSSQIEKMLLNERKSKIEYNHDVESTKKTDSIKATTIASVQLSKHLDTQTRIEPPINTMLLASQEPETIPNGDAIDKIINVDSRIKNTSIIPPTTAPNKDVVMTTTTFIMHSQNSQNDLSVHRYVDGNKISTQETISTTESSAQTTKPAPISMDFTTMSSSDNVTPSSPTSSLTEIDGLLPNVNVRTHFNGGQTGVQTETSNPLSVETSIQTNDKDKNRLTGANENKIPLQAETNTDLGQFEATQTPILIKNTLNIDYITIAATADVATQSSAPDLSGGTITKVSDEEKSSSKEAKHENQSNNNKKYNNKNNKDKSKKKANEEGGVSDPNGKLNDNLLMAFISSTVASSSVSDIGSDGVHSTTIRSMESHFVDGIDSSDENQANHSTDDEIHTEIVINADVTISTPPPVVSNGAGISYIPSVAVGNDMNSVSTASAPISTEASSTKFEHTQVESTIQNHDTVAEKPASTTFAPEVTETKDSITEISPLDGKQLITKKPVKVSEHNHLDKQYNGNTNDMNISDNKLTTRPNTDTKTTIKTIPEIPSVLDYDKSSEEIFDIVHETSTTTHKTDESPVSHKRPPNAPNDEFFLPADDLDTDTASVAPISSTTTVSQSTVQINTESSIVRPGTGSLEPTITVPILISTSDSKQQTTDLNKASTISRDSDTIFYISNTEVKVVESSVPTPNSKQENQVNQRYSSEQIVSIYL